MVAADRPRTPSRPEEPELARKCASRSTRDVAPHRSRRSTVRPMRPRRLRCTGLPVTHSQRPVTLRQRHCYPYPRTTQSLQPPPTPPLSSRTPLSTFLPSLSLHHPPSRLHPTTPAALQTTNPAPPFFHLLSPSSFHL